VKCRPLNAGERLTETEALAFTTSTLHTSFTVVDPNTTDTQSL